MSKAARAHPWAVALCTAAMAFAVRAQTPASSLVTRVSAEISTPPQKGAGVPGAGLPGAGLPATGASAPGPQLKAAERVVPGDVLIYTVEVRNAGRYAVESAVVVQPIPNHTMYLADSAVGPGVDVDYSVDGGRSFDKPENLLSPQAAASTGRAQAAAGAVPTRAAPARAAPANAAPVRAVLATASEYTHIRWRLHNRLKPNSIAYVRFRAQVK